MENNSTYLFKKNNKNVFFTIIKNKEYEVSNIFIFNKNGIICKTNKSDFDTDDDLSNINEYLKRKINKITIFGNLKKKIKINFFEKDNFIIKNSINKNLVDIYIYEDNFKLYLFKRIKMNNKIYIIYKTKINKDIVILEMEKDLGRELEDLKKKYEDVYFQIPCFALTQEKDIYSLQEITKQLININIEIVKIQNKINQYDINKN